MTSNSLIIFIFSDHTETSNAYYFEQINVIEKKNEIIILQIELKFDTISNNCY